MSKMRDVTEDSDSDDDENAAAEELDVQPDAAATSEDSPRSLDENDADEHDDDYQEKGGRIIGNLPELGAVL